MLDHNTDTSMYTCYYCYYIHKYLILNMHKLSSHLTSIAYLFVVIKAIIALLSSMLTPEVVCCYNELTAILGNHVRRTFLTNTDLVHCRKLWEWKKNTNIFISFQQLNVQRYLLFLFNPLFRLMNNVDK